MCHACPEGRYQPTKTSGLGVEDAAKCIDADYGHYVPDIAMKEQKPCEKGHFQSSKGQSTCVKCPRGSYQLKEGSKFCEYAPIGYYIPEAGWGSGDDYTYTNPL